MKTLIYYLESPSNARFHFGEVLKESSLSSSSIRPYSDTLFGAIIHNAFFLNPQKANDLIQLFRQEKLVISSVLFFVEQNGKNIIFLPKPISYDFIENSNKEIDHKKIKNVKMLSTTVIINGLGPEAWFDVNQCTSLQNGEFICTKNELQLDNDVNIYQKAITPKNPISYTSNPDDERKIYYQTDVFLSNNDSVSTGYYFLLKYSEKISQDSLTFLDDCIQLIQNFGLGGDRSAGAGAILNIKKQEFKWEIKDNFTHFLNLSLLIPKENDYRSGRYRIIKRGGQPLNEHQHLKYVHCILEGGVFPEEIKGQILNIGPANLKYGIPFYLPFNPIN